MLLFVVGGCGTAGMGTYADKKIQTYIMQTVVCATLINKYMSLGDSSFLRQGKKNIRKKNRREGTFWGFYGSPPSSLSTERKACDYHMVQSEFSRHWQPPEHVFSKSGLNSTFWLRGILIKVHCY